MSIDQLQSTFQEQYGQPAQQAFFCPGRVNLIGEHIDYNGGLVMPCAIDFGTWLLIAPNTSGTLNFRSVTFKDETAIQIAASYNKHNNSWYNYPLGVLHYFAAGGFIPTSGYDLLYYGNLPVGSGLSSSASIEMVTAFAFNQLLQADYNKTTLVKLTKQVENEFIGVSTGIMDQFAVAYGEAGKAIQLDCESLAYQMVDVDLGDHLLTVINTNKPRNLAESKYNERVNECRQALTMLQTELHIQNLCDIDTEQLNQFSHLISDSTILKRARHVVEENDRVKLAGVYLNNGDLVEFGKLMYASHHSLRHLYEVSGTELDTIVDFCLTYKGATGARMTGAGFGGCAIALVKANMFDDFKEHLSAYYLERIGYNADVYQTAPAAGVHEVKF